MISVAAAKRFGKENFPKSPEKLAEKLGIEVCYSDLDGCDGWCLTTGSETIIRINSKNTPVRQRFTLAHELGHLILGIPTVIGESYEDMLGSDSEEERQVDDLASELLLPIGVVRSAIHTPPVIAQDIRKLAKKANVSELATSIRICKLAREIGIINAAAVFFDSDDQFQWKYSETITMSKAEAIDLLGEARSTEPEAYRHEQDDGIVVASIIENHHTGSTTLFVQFLPHEVGSKLSPQEERAKVEAKLFKNNEKLRQKMSGYMGALKTRIKGKTPQAVEADFWKRYESVLTDTPVNTRAGREYVKSRIVEWFAV